ISPALVSKGRLIGWKELPGGSAEKVSCEREEIGIAPLADSITAAAENTAAGWTPPMAAISGAAARILVSLPRDHGDARWPFVRFAASPSPNVTIGGVIAAPPVRWGLRCAPGGMVCREPQVPCRFATASRLARPATGRGV